LWEKKVKIQSKNSIRVINYTNKTDIKDLLGDFAQAANIPKENMVFEEQDSKVFDFNLEDGVSNITYSSS
jgi:hypothetical protein